MLNENVKIQYKRICEFLEYAISSFNLGLPQDRKFNVITFMGNFDGLFEYSFLQALGDKDSNLATDFSGMLAYSNLKKLFDHSPEEKEIALLSNQLLMVLSILNYQVPSHELFKNLITAIYNLYDSLLNDDSSITNTTIFKVLGLGDELTDETAIRLKNREMNLTKYQDVINEKILKIVP